jgi:hypothetical protein
VCFLIAQIVGVGHGRTDPSVQEQLLPDTPLTLKLPKGWHIEEHANVSGENRPRQCACLFRRSDLYGRRYLLRPQDDQL